MLRKRRHSASDAILSRCCRLADFLKALPGAIKRAEPSLTLYLGGEVPLDRRVGLRELQTNFVYTTVLAKKCKVRMRSIVPGAYENIRQAHVAVLN